MAPLDLKHSDVPAGAGTVHVVEAGDPSGAPFVFLHGWPTSWRSWEAVLGLAGASGVRAIAIDLPGIGQSASSRTDGTKRGAAAAVREAIDALGLERPTLVGTDAGGMITYAYLRDYPEELARAVIMNVVIPGLSPWEAVLANPHVWHFAFHTIPSLPELLVAGKERPYFDFFYDATTFDPARLPDARRDAHASAYATPETLAAGFDWYRSMQRDVQDNTSPDRQTAIKTPLLYLRGDHEPGDMDAYVAGFHGAGIERVEDALVISAGHYAPEESPESTWQLIEDFARRT
jgi:pimeloyl-ACP methyl ester carboxylesterase